MIAKLCFVALFSVAFAQVGDFLHGSGSLGREVFSEEDMLKDLINHTMAQINEVSQEIDSTHGEYTNITAHRQESLTSACIKQKDAFKKLIRDVVRTGLTNNKDLKCFQCVSDKAHETFLKFDGIKDRIPTDTDQKIQKGLQSIVPFRVITKGFTEYLKELFKTKLEEINKAKSDYDKRVILKATMKKTAHLETVLENFSKHMADTTDEFFHDYLQYVTATENALTKTQKDGAEGIKKCVA